MLTAAEFNNALAFAMYSTDLWDLAFWQRVQCLRRPQRHDGPGRLFRGTGPDGKYSSNTAFAFKPSTAGTTPMTTNAAAMR